MRACIERYIQRARRFLREDAGPSAVEYAVLLALIVVVAASAIRMVGSSVHGLWAYIDTAVQTHG